MELVVTFRNISRQFRVRWNWLLHLVTFPDNPSEMELVVTFLNISWQFWVRWNWLLHCVTFRDNFEWDGVGFTFRNISSEMELVVTFRNILRQFRARWNCLAPSEKPSHWEGGIGAADPVAWRAHNCITTGIRHKYRYRRKSNNTHV